MSLLKPYRKTVHRTLKLRQSDVSLWHSLLFMTNIGTPVVVGLSLGNEQLGIIGGVAGLLFSLADNDGNLSERFAMLGRALAMLLIFGILGHTFGGYSAGFWLTFIALTFVTGWMSLKKSASATAFRYGALALVSTAGLPGSGPGTVGFVLLAAAVCALTRTLGQIYFPGAVTVSPPQNCIEPPDGIVGLRFCIAYAVTVAAALLTGQIEGATHPVWVATSTLLVMQPDARATYQRIAQRVFGTLLGVVAATVVVHLFQSAAVLTAVVLIIAFVVPHGTSRNYWLHAALTALLILVLYDFAAAGHGFEERLVRERFIDAAIGCALALIGTLFAFPPYRGSAKEPRATDASL